ncbi:hypothetical protein KFK09_024676 [Dendrobium nobile]|uniref:Uncharacterized protein n=1 Tax=Dendrobium nobile TaxID=94219 RepID=A0A8T3AEG1_DENNO|nr:hypothetical protein KFK09_024676 [Dendrobium nobile]
MCPLRFILVFLSATLAGYFAWKSIRSPTSCAALEDPDGEEHSEGELKKDRSVRVGRMIGDGFWMVLDMASGRYLWRIIKER